MSLIALNFATFANTIGCKCYNIMYCFYLFVMHVRSACLTKGLDHETEPLIPCINFCSVLFPPQGKISSPKG